MKQIKILLLLGAFAYANLEMNAQYTGPGATPQFYTVKQVIENASRLDKSDAIVKIKGFIVEQVNADTYWFKDTTGKILAEISKKHLPATPFNDKTEVILVGEVDYDLLEGTEIEVEQILLTK